MSELLRQKTLALVELCKETAQNGGNIVITGHDNPDADSVISAVMMQGLLWRAGVDAEIKLPTPPDNVTLRDMEMLGIWDDSLVCDLEGSDLLLLVDHHKSFYSNTVIGCVDHHTTPPAPTCEIALVEKASSCGKLIFDMMLACDIATDDAELLALYSVYLDTQSCRSSKFNAADLPWVDTCIKKHGIDRKDIERMGFCLNSPTEPVDVIAMYAYKRYEFQRVSASTAIQIDENDGEWDRIIPLAIELLGRKVKDDKCAAWAFVVNKPQISRSDIYWIYENGEVQKIELDRLASRSKDVIPVVKAL